MDYSKPITSSAEAAVFILALHDAGKLFHFDDSPETVIDARTGARTFTDSEAAALIQRVPELFEYLADPFELAVALNRG